MNVEEFKERVIADGIASVKQHEKRPERLRGGIAGFELCRNLNSMWDFQEEMSKRHQHKRDMVSLMTFSPEKLKELRGEGMYGLPADMPVPTSEEYWEYRCATVQVEFVFERMLVAWSQMGLYEGPVS